MYYIALVPQPQFTTRVEFRTGLLTWIAVGLICVFTLWIGICCIAIIPFFIDSMKDVYHINPNTGEVVGVYKRLS